MATVAELEERYGPLIVWRHTGEKAACKHALRRSFATQEVGNYRSAECGTGPAWYHPTGWLGTGNQTEYERNDELRECKRCIKRLDPKQGQPAPEKDRNIITSGLERKAR